MGIKKQGGPESRITIVDMLTGRKHMGNNESFTYPEDMTLSEQLSHSIHLNNRMINFMKKQSEYRETIHPDDLAQVHGLIFRLIYLNRLFNSISDTYGDSVPKDCDFSDYMGYLVDIMADMVTSGPEENELSITRIIKANDVVNNAVSHCRLVVVKPTDFFGRLLRWLSKTF